jgi:hypothetical protein
MFYLELAIVSFVATGIACWFFIEIDRHINQD